MTARKPRPLVAVPSPPTPIADLSDLAERAHDLPIGTLNCREHRRHDWRPSTARKQGRGFYRMERCSDCHSERWQELDSRGMVTRSGVKYSEGYLNPPGTGRVNQAGQGVYRLELLGRLINGERLDHTAPKRASRKVANGGK